MVVDKQLKSKHCNLSFLQALADTNGFLTGETVVVDNQPKPVVRFWDLACEPLL